MESYKNNVPTPTKKMPPGGGIFLLKSLLTN